MLDIQDIKSLLTHRYPFLLVDRVTELTLNESITGYKNVTFNEPFFQGHFPELPIMPGVLIVEAMAQLCGVLGYKTLATEAADQPQDQQASSICVITGIDNARFKRPVGPGDQLVLSAELQNRKQTLWKFQCQATVDGELVAKALVSVAEKSV